MVQLEEIGELERTDVSALGAYFGPPVAMEGKLALSDVQLFVSFLGNAERS
jgi:hypothetical protein